jgi:biotin carboxylase
MHRLLLLIPTTTYRAQDFLNASTRLGVDVVVGTDRKQALADAAPGRTLALDFDRPERAVAEIRDSSVSSPLDAVVGADEETVILAAMACQALGLRGNPPEAVRTTRNKHALRARLSEAGLKAPSFQLLSVDDPVGEVARTLAYPCVLKPLELSASRGVLRADDPAGFEEAFRRIAAILKTPEIAKRGENSRRILVEDYIPGAEVALEGLLERGDLRSLALFDKPDPLEGPTFEETLYVTPSRLPDAVQAAMLNETARACDAVGLREGPIHAELRLAPEGPIVLEVAARSIGGLCSRTLRFGAGISQEELILRHALGMDTSVLERERGAAGVMMIPVPRRGLLTRVDGADAARAVAGIEDVVISIPIGGEVVPLPEGHRYLGFIFARGETPEGVELALRDAHTHLHFEIE